jgi:uncharacterized protein YndB with AHSA1/START domain
VDFAVVETIIQQPVERVWAALMEPGNYPRWVVGARKFRGADSSWPEPGSAFHHAVGIGPLQLKDHTKLLELDEGVRVVLEARARPAGRAEVELTLEDVPGGTCVIMRERAVTGPGAYVPQPLHDALTKRRNHQGLQRLGEVVAQQSP